MTEDYTELMQSIRSLCECVTDAFRTFVDNIKPEIFKEFVEKFLSTNSGYSWEEIARKERHRQRYLRRYNNHGRRMKK